ncbi:MAG: hypothetical protein HKN85_03615 [Gammaproteobacteria bacterium]|nr:hypothetical protein [Gammaproteobacteria bacterium]
MNFKPLSFSRLQPLQRILLSAFCALIGYGVWAYLANAMHGYVAGIKAAAVQGSYSFLLTFVMTLLIEAFYRQISRFNFREIVSKYLTIVLTCAIIFSTSWWVNALAGTPEIFNTVILGYVVGGLYTIGYVFGLSAEKMRKQSSII